MRRPTPATAIATVALFFALTGTGLAVGHYVITSTKQIKPSVLRSLRGQTGARGPEGPQGPNGPMGAAGAPGSFSTSDVTTVTGPQETMCAEGGGGCDVAGSLAKCPNGDTVISGGYEGSVDLAIADDEPLGGDSWDVVAVNNSPLSGHIKAYAVCAS